MMMLMHANDVFGTIAYIMKIKIWENLLYLFNPNEKNPPFE